MIALRILPLLLLTAAPAWAQGLTVKAGETWIFSIANNGQPAKARKASPSAKPALGQVLVTVKPMMGTTMTITSNNAKAYTYKAQLVGSEKPVIARSCTLPANNRLSFENWPQKASAVRLSDFKPASKNGSCP